MSGKSLIPELKAKKLLANQIVGFFDWLYPLNELMYDFDFLHADRYPQGVEAEAAFFYCACPGMHRHA